jgi:diguanylate cyclase (GGDEF)-like protein/PAS domain S-box-containing protein
MQRAIDLSWMKSLSLPSGPATLNERLALALASSNQIAFDWHIAADLLHFNGRLENGLTGTSLDVSRVYKSSELHSLLHEDDKPHFRARLLDALKANGQTEGTLYQVEIRVKDMQCGWRWICIAGKIVERDECGRATRMVGTVSDIDGRKQREHDLSAREKIKSAILTAAIDCIVTINDRGEIISFNGAAEQAFGRREQDVAGTRLHDLLILSGLEQGKAGASAFDAELPLNQRIELSAIRSDGSSFPIELAIVELPVQEHRVRAVFIRDISERKRVEELQLGQSHILNMVASGTPLPDILSEIKNFSETLSNGGTCSILLLNVIPVSANAMQAREAEHHLQLPVSPACLSRPILGKDGVQLGTFLLHVASSEPRWEQLADTSAYLAGLAIQSRLSEERIRYLAHYDGLTGLPNRFLFKEYFDLALKSAKRHGKKFAVCFVDLDKFKEVNDTLGHDAGDEVLRVIARRLRGALRHTDKMARMGGDEFYILIEDLNDGFHAAEVAGKLLEQASRPVRIREAQCRLGASIGISIYPDDGTDEQTLLRQADCAMYKAKKSGKNAYRFFSTEADRSRMKASLATRNVLLAAGLRCSAFHDKDLALRG